MLGFVGSSFSATIEVRNYSKHTITINCGIGTPANIQGGTITSPTKMTINNCNGDFKAVLSGFASCIIKNIGVNDTKKIDLSIDRCIGGFCPPPAINCNLAR